LLEKLPVLVSLFSPQPTFVYAVLICPAAEAVFLKNTVAGFRLKAVGLSCGPCRLYLGQR
jgi:ABC-type uncharacterized transport system permease subunit